MTLVPLIFSSLKRMTCGTHTSCPSSTSEWPNMATRGALHRCPSSLVAHRRGCSRVLAVGGACGRRPRGSSTPPVARAGLGGALPHGPSAGLGGARPHRSCRRPRVPVTRGSSGWPPASSGSGWAVTMATGVRHHPRGSGGGHRNAAAPEGRQRPTHGGRRLRGAAATRPQCPPVAHCGGVEPALRRRGAPSHHLS
jgi:hypothetical protein